MNRRALVAGVCAIVAVSGALVARTLWHGDAPPTSGPFGVPDPGTLCWPATGTTAFDGTNVLRNRTDAPMTVDAVRLVDAENLEVLESALAPIFDRTSIGNVPPTPGAHGGAAWKQREPAVGGVVPAREDRNVVLHLRLIGAGPHRYREVEVIYHDPKGDMFRFHTRTAARIVDEGQAC